MGFFEKLKSALMGSKLEPTKKTAPTNKRSTAPTQKEPYVYVTANGKKFHYSLACPGIRNSKEYKMPLSKARKAGYTACDKCCYSYLHE